MNYQVFVRGLIVTTEKNIRIYYNKAPVVIFGLLFPLFMFLAFYIGREIRIQVFFPGFIAMVLFFASSSVGPLITPWEKQAGTYERLLSFPVTVDTIILGDTLAGSIYGVLITLITLITGALFLDIDITGIGLLVLATLLGTVCFAALGVFMSSPASRQPSQIMMLSALIRFPLIFISGVFIPLQELHGAGMVLSYFSPLTYLVDLFQWAMGGAPVHQPVVDLTLLLVFTCGFLFAAHLFHKRNMMKGL